jgi:hypothetical protein
MGQAIVIKAGGKDFDAELNDSVTAGANLFASDFLFELLPRGDIKYSL